MADFLKNLSNPADWLKVDFFFVRLKFAQILLQC